MIFGDVMLWFFLALSAFMAGVFLVAVVVHVRAECARADALAAKGWLFVGYSLAGPMMVPPETFGLPPDWRNRK